jgi:hypothetical protein
LVHFNALIRTMATALILISEGQEKMFHRMKR